MKRILQVTNYMDRGGVETLLMNLYRTIDRTEFQFDFLTHPHTVDTVYSYEEEIKDLGGKVYKAPSFIKDPVAYKRFIVSFFDEHPEYHIVHAHNLDSAAMVYLREAKKRGCYTIAHSHNTKDHGNAIKRQLLRLARKQTCRYADYFYACSPEAAEYAFGKKIASSNSCRMLHNGIDLSKYQVNEEIHQRNKKKLLPQCSGPVFCNVGRLMLQKNQTFLLDIFSQIVRRDDSARLIVLGEGELHDDLLRKALNLNIADKVLFLGSVPNVPDYLKASDVFLMPSLYEGLPLAAVEAQACGLPSLLTADMSPLTFCTDLVCPISLSDSPDAWARAALESYEANRGRRADRVEQVRQSGFDIKQVAMELCDFYSSHGSFPSQTATDNRMRGLA
ncbi:glycosyltransferase [Bifidobacterium catenulatum]|uniref:glycosyltransferase n=1 Tax=Bifidobacterium catenulatum TaxID=1686 RepID=UPI003F90750C